MQGMITCRYMLRWHKVKKMEPRRNQRALSTNVETKVAENDDEEKDGAAAPAKVIQRNKMNNKI